VVDVRARAAAGVPAIRVRGLRKAFSSRARKGSRAERARQIVAVDGVSFEVRAGQVFGLLGPNSSGKTSTLRCVGTLSRPDEGSVEVYGVDCVKDGVMVRGMMSYVAQSAGLDKVLTGREHLELFGALAHLGRDVLRRNIDQLVELLDLGDFIDRQTKVYSGGVARRLDMAIALMQQPVVLVLDEPTVGLDTASRTAIWRILRRLRDNGVAILLTSHYLEEVEMLADSVAIMDKGVIIAEGRVADLKAALGGDRVTVRIQEFTDGDTAEAAAAACVAAGVARSAVVNRLRANALELVVDDADSRAGAKVVEVLAAAGHPSLFSFTQARPSLDDVYVAATGKRLEDADREAKGLRDAKAERKENML
jgi:ABC-2 type transport system ATP-binding protein